MQSSSQIITINKPTPSFLQARCPSCRPTNNVEALKRKISHSMDLVTTSSPGGLPTLSLTTDSSWLPWGRVAMPLISPLMPVPQFSTLQLLSPKSVGFDTVSSTTTVPSFKSSRSVLSYLHTHPHMVSK